MNASHFPFGEYAGKRSLRELVSLRCTLDSRDNRSMPPESGARSGVRATASVFPSGDQETPRNFPKSGVPLRPVL